MSDNTSDLVLQIGTLSLLSLYLLSPGGGVFFYAMNRTFVCIDLKSFYASVECVERGLDPLTTNLVVSDPERGEKTICLAVSPSMKKLGVHNRCRVFEIPKHIEYIMAPPRMQLYIDYSANIYAVYLKYVSKEDIHVYSIDEVFMDVTHYLVFHRMTAKQLAVAIMDDVLQTTGITATAGIGTNLYLAKIAMDIMAKHSDDHIGILTEQTYREQLWDHKPLTDFWQIGNGKARRLEKAYMFTMGDIAARTQWDEEFFYKTFGIDGEILVDHAWGIEPVTMADIKSYKSDGHSLSNGQVLSRPYKYQEARLVFREMIEVLCTDMFSKNLVTQGCSWWVSYDYKSLEVCPSYDGPLSMDFYGRIHPKHSNGTVKLPTITNNIQIITAPLLKSFDDKTDHRLLYRRLGVCANDVKEDSGVFQLNMFIDYEALERDRKLQGAMLEVRRKFGANALFKGMNLMEGATSLERNQQIGGHKA